MINNRNFKIICSLRENTVENDINVIRNAIYDGAEGFMIHLEKLNDEYHNVEDLKTLLNYAADKQVIAVNYRNKHKREKKDEDLVEGLFNAIKAGASMIDVVADIYNPSFDEISYDKEAINKQRLLIEKAHELGAKVMLSSHTFRFLTIEESLKHCLELESRGADMVKIAVTANSEEEMLEVNKTTIALKETLKVPFFHCCMGQFGKLHRVYSAFLGSSIVLCVQNYNENSNPKEQPLLRSTKEIFDRLDFTLARDIYTGTIRK